MVTYSAKKMHREIIHDAKIPINRHYYKKKDVVICERPQMTTKRDVCYPILIQMFNLITFGILTFKFLCHQKGDYFRRGYIACSFRHYLLRF